MKIKLIDVFLICVSMMVITSSAQAAAFLDDFSTGDLSAYTLSVVNMNSTQTPAVSFVSNSGAIQVAKGTPGTNAEQVLFLRNNSLDVGETLRVDTSCVTNPNYADFGIAVSYTVDPVDRAAGLSQDVRTDEISLYMKSQTNNIGYVGFDSPTGILNMGSSSGAVSGMTAAQFAAVTGLYITRTSSTTFDLGYDTTLLSGDQLLKTFTVTNTAIGNAVGFYADLRATQDPYGNLDNLRVVPEPATAVMALLGFLGMGLIWLRKRS
jgi:PEP-CTERM motif